MKLVVLGATGGIGLEIVRQAIAQGHSVTAFVRSPEPLKPFANRITTRQGNLLNSDELAQAITGHDAILSGFGPRVPIAKSAVTVSSRCVSPFTKSRTFCISPGGSTFATVASTFPFCDQSGCALKIWLATRS